METKSETKASNQQKFKVTEGSMDEDDYNAFFRDSVRLDINQSVDEFTYYFRIFLFNENDDISRYLWLLDVGGKGYYPVITSGSLGFDCDYNDRERDDGEDELEWTVEEVMKRVQEKSKESVAKVFERLSIK